MKAFRAIIGFIIYLLAQGLLWILGILIPVASVASVFLLFGTTWGIVSLFGGPVTAVIFPWYMALGRGVWWLVILQGLWILGLAMSFASMWLMGSERKAEV